MKTEYEYIYLGDRLTRNELRGQQCTAIRNKAGKCICGKLATMLVRFANGQTHVVLRRQLRRIDKMRTNNPGCTT